MDWLSSTWPWYVSGPLIALVMFTLLYLGKGFGFSSNLRTLCSLGGGGKFAEFFRIDWKKQGWNLIFLIGSVIGGFLAARFIPTKVVHINPTVANELSTDYGITSANQAYLPTELYTTESLSNPYILVILIIAGALVGFGARYAGGCTSGHAISGLSNLQLPSLVAVIGFFVGGLLMVHFLFPLIF